MSYKLSFGKHEGRTVEWLFFNAPWYTEWIYDNNIYRQEHSFSSAEGEYFLELYRRASHLKGTCPYCKERELWRMGLSTHHLSGVLGCVAFYCEECEYLGGSTTRYCLPSFFLPYTSPRCEQLMITHAIKTHYIGSGSLSQKRMEEFFYKDDNFVDALPHMLQDIAA